MKSLVLDVFALSAMCCTLMDNVFYYLAFGKANNVKNCEFWEMQCSKCRMILSVQAVTIIVWYIFYPSTEVAAVLQLLLFLSICSWEWTGIFPASPIPWGIVLSFISIFLPHGRLVIFHWIKIGVVTGNILFLSISLSMISVIGLLVWSFTFQHNHGPIQKFLEKSFTVTHIPIFAATNALIEEIEYRGVIMEGLIRQREDIGVFSPLFQVICISQAILFASEHFQMGFPSGYIGFLMVFVWGWALGVIRYLAKGMLAVYLIHVVADLTIGYIIWWTKKHHENTKKLS